MLSESERVIGDPVFDGLGCNPVEASRPEARERRAWRTIGSWGLARSLIRSLAAGFRRSRPDRRWGFRGARWASDRAHAPRERDRVDQIRRTLILRVLIR